MHLRGPICIFVLAFLSVTVSAQDLKPGEIHATVAVQEDPAYSYALYLPSNYTPQKRWPILLAFDPFGRGVSPVKLFQEGARNTASLLSAAIIPVTSVIPQRPSD